MSAGSKSESLAHRDARQYCQRRHQRTMGRCAREERQSDALLARQLRHLQRSRAYRAKELDREQEKCLTDLVTIFDRQCQIATARLARRLKDALGDQNIAEGLWKKRSNDAQRLGQAKPDNCSKQGGSRHSYGTARNSFGNSSRGFTRTNTTPPAQHHNVFKVSNNGAPVNGLNPDNRISRLDSPVPWQQRTRAKAHDRQLPNLANQRQLFRNQLSIRESVQLQAPNDGVARRPTSSRQGATRPKTAPVIGKASNSRWDELSTQVRCPQHCGDAPAHVSTARSLRCLLQDTSESKTATPVLDAPEDVCFRRQYMACVMSRKLPVSGLRSGSFAQQDDVRKKMDARRKCMEELRMTNRQRAKSAPAGLVRICRNDLSAK